MTISAIQVQYDELEIVAQRFDQQAEVTEQLQQQIQQRFDNLQNGSWVGRGADTFFSEMENDVFPALNRLILAMEDGRDATRQIVEVLRMAEEEAAGGFIVWNGQTISDHTGLDFFVKRTMGTYNILDGSYSLYKLYSEFDRPITNVSNFKEFLQYRTSFGNAYRDLFTTKTGQLTLLLGGVEAAYEGYSDLREGQSVSEVLVSESVEFGLETGIRVAAYTNPVTGSAMLIWDTTVLIGDFVGVEVVSLNDVTDWAGNAVYDPKNAAEDAKRFGGGLIQNIDALVPPC